MAETLDSVAAALQAAAKKAPKLAGMAIRKTAFDIQGDAQQFAPYQTGNLKSSIGVSTQGELTATVYVTAEYGRYVEEGTAPHEIKPKKGKFLKFPGRNGAVFTTRVSHPGTKAQPYMQPAVDRRLPKLIEAVGQIVSKIL